jgi:Amt family ammonium transporter
LSWLTTTQRAFRGIAFVIKLVIGLRASPEIESAGLDISEHGEEAYISL